ncbi:MAG: peptidyl-prolyl cis-trans isomerase, EpsD family [Rhodocyclales bacterium]|nr:peptidyl-prolyl cis-trans isomerase, EpsD family [Rhodocyclales bacterium]
MSSRIALLVLMTCLTLVLSACGRASAVGKQPGLVATVAGKEIFADQVEALQSKHPVAADDVAAAPDSEALERLIDEELLAKRAIEQKLDSNPDVQQQLEAARRAVLARALGDSLAAEESSVAPADVKEFFNKNPHLFAKRRIYTLIEANVRCLPQEAKAVTQQLASAGGLTDAIAWMHGKHIAVTTSRGRKPAEQLSLDLLPRFAAMKDGDIAYMSMPGGLTIIQLQSSVEEPIAEADATPVIVRYLASQRRATLLGKELRRLREANAIEYHGEYTRLAGTPAGT